MKRLLQISGAVSGLAILVGIGLAAAQMEQRIHSSPDHVQEAEKFFNNYDEKKAYGEYIIDSIEEVNTQAWRKEQREFKAFVMEYLGKQDSLIRLNIQISDQTKKLYEEGH